MRRHMTLKDVKRNHGSLKSDWTSVTLLTLLSCWQKNARKRFVLIETNVNISMNLILLVFNEV